MNEIQLSKLILKEYYITESTIISIYPESKQRVRLDRLKVFADFDIFSNDERNNDFSFLINFNIRCNEEENPGYFIEVGAVGKFILKGNDSMSDKTKHQYILYTALPMVINQTRLFIQSVTAMHSLGAYLFPALDLNSLIENKINEND